jgi:hypothetical protein
MGLGLTKSSILGENCLEFCHGGSLYLSRSLEESGIENGQNRRNSDFLDVVDISFAISVWVWGNFGGALRWPALTFSITHPALFDELLQRHLINSMLEFSTTTTPTPSEPPGTMSLFDIKTMYPVGSWLRAVECPGRISSEFSPLSASLPASWLQIRHHETHEDLTTLEFNSFGRDICMQMDGTVY